MRLTSSMLLSLGLIAVAGTATAAQRWYSPEQVATGEKVFAANCASCHGSRAEATKDWKTPGPDGQYPPPPLNGSAHAWHHDMDVLRRTVREGGARLGGSMPAFKDTLSADQVDDAIAFFQSLWSDEIYATWDERNQSKGLQAVAKQPPPSTPGPELRTRMLQQRLGADTELEDPEPTPVQGVYRVGIGSEQVYLSEDGRYVFMGELIDLRSGRNLSKEAQAQRSQRLIAGFADKDMLIYPAIGPEKARLTVFTDTSCPYCRKLHGDLPRLRQAGVRVNYIAFSRGGPSGQGSADLKSVWCAPDRQQAMDIAMGVRDGELPAAACPATAVDAGYALGTALGLRGTPMIVLANGRRIEGYVEPGRLLTLLGLPAGTAAK